MKIRLDYRVGAKPFPSAGAALLTVAAGALALSGAYYYRTVEQAAYWEAKAGHIEGGQARRSPADPREMQETALEIRHANQVLGQITIPWDGLFQAVEWSSGSDVALLTIEPDAEKHQVKISGEAKNIPALWNYMGHLAAQDAFSSVTLRSHQVERREREHPVRFALVVEWRVPE